MAEENSLHKRIRERLKNLEGYAGLPHVKDEKRFGTESKFGGYLDSRGYATTGIGHLVSRAEPGSKQFHRDVEKFNKDYKDIIPNLGESYSYHNLNEEDSNKLFNKDLEKHLKTVRNKIPSFDKLPSDLQVELTQAEYRGDIVTPHKKPDGTIVKGHKWVKLLNEGNFGEASKEFLRNKEYKVSKERGTGVHKRMEDVSTALRETGEAEREIGEEKQNIWNKDAMDQIKEQSEEQGKRDQIMNLFRKRNRNQSWQN